MIKLFCKKENQLTCRFCEMANDFTFVIIECICTNNRENAYIYTKQVHNLEKCCLYLAHLTLKKPV